MTASQRGFTYLEVLLAVVILAGGATSAAFALAQVRDTAASSDQTTIARYLVQDAVAWLRSLPRIDDSNPVFGVESGETTVDDVDDLDGRVEDGPRDLGGNSFPTDWTRSWTVDSVSLTDPGVTVADGSTTLLRVRIDVAYRKTTIHSETLLLARTP